MSVTSLLHRKYGHICQITFGQGVGIGRARVETSGLDTKNSDSFVLDPKSLKCFGCLI